MTRCVFLDDRGKRCARSAEEGLFCGFHGTSPIVSTPTAEYELAPVALDVECEGDAAEPIELPPWRRLVRRAAAALLLGFFLVQTYVMIRELWKGP